MKKDDLAKHLSLILKTTDNALDFVKGLTKEQLFNDERTKYAVNMCLVIIGESAKKILDKHKGFSDQHPEIPWYEMLSMRNRIAHDYSNIKFNIVWDIVSHNLPELIKNIEKVKVHFDRLEKNDIKIESEKKINFDEWER